MSVDIVIGLQRGDEGKGRVVDEMSADYAMVARFNGGANAGHTLSYNGGALPLHQVPSGIRNPGTRNIIGNGVLLDVVRLAEEVDTIRQAGIAVSVENLAISDAAHLALPHHIALDRLREAGVDAQGSTGRGISFAAADKYERSGLRAAALADPERLAAHATARLTEVNEQLEARGLKPYDVQVEIDKLLVAAAAFMSYVTDTVVLVQERLAQGDNLLAEGAQAATLDIEQGPYPFVTSSHTGTAGAQIGLGIGPAVIGRVIGVVKATKSHVGAGPFPTEIHDEALAARLRGTPDAIDGEYGKSTGRARRLGDMDIPEIRRAVGVNSVTSIVLNKLDCVPRYGSVVRIATAYNFDGKIVRLAPSSVALLERCQPVYTELPTWSEDISQLRRFADLPSAAQDYVHFLEAQIGVPITQMGVGPHPDQVIRI